MAVPSRGSGHQRSHTGAHPQRASISISARDAAVEYDVASREVICEPTKQRHYHMRCIVRVAILAKRYRFGRLTGWHVFLNSILKSSNEALGQCCTQRYGVYPYASRAQHEGQPLALGKP